MESIGLSGRSRWMTWAFVAVIFSSGSFGQSRRAQAFTAHRQPKLTWATTTTVKPPDGAEQSTTKIHGPFSNFQLWATNNDDKSPEHENEPDEDEDRGLEENPPLITQEMFLRDLLQDPQVLKKKKKKNGGGYQPMDNRDHLPYVIEVMHPEPYTKRQVIQEKARQRTKEENTNRKRKAKAPPVLSSSISSSLQLQQQDGSTQILGEFALDKSTTSGDWILIGDVEYQVTSAKCQYKYAGGKRFVMVRKILQVKEIRRLEQEAQLLRQLQATPDADVDASVLLDLWEDDASTK